MKLPEFFSGCLKHFHCSNCSLDHTPANNFIKSQWQNRTHSKFYLLYRWIIGLYFLGVVITALSNHQPGKFWYFFIYLTNWGITLCALTTLYAAVLVTIWYCHPKYTDNTNDIVDMPTSFKVYWWFNNITLVISIVITIIYWAILFDNTHTLNAVNVMTHATNSALMFLDMMIVSHPYRLLHVIQPIAFGVVYAIFSVFYHLAGGVNVKGEPFIYFIMDWSKPGTAAVTIIGVLVLAIIVHICLMLVYYLRTKIYMQCFKQEDILPTTSHSNSYSNDQSANTISMVFGHENKVFDIASEKNNNRLANSSLTAN